MAKKRQRKQKEKRETRKQQVLSRRERERQRQVFVGLGILAFMVIGLLVAGIVDQFVLTPRSPIAVVDGIPIRTDAFQRRLAYQRFTLQEQLRQWQQFQSQLDPSGENAFFNQQISQLASEISNVEGLSLQVLDQMIDEVLIREEARKQGITVSPDEVQARIEAFFGFDREALTAPPEPTPTPTPAPSEPITATGSITGTGGITATGVISTPTPVPTPTPMTEEDFRRLYADYLQRLQAEALGFSEAEFRAVFEMDILRQKLTDAMCSDVPKTEEQVHARHILIKPKTPAPEPVEEGTPTPTPDPKAEEQADAAALQLAQEINARLDAGEDFADLAREYSDDPVSREKGGDLDWFGRGKMVKEFEEAAFSLEPGQVSDPVKTSFGYHIIQVLEKDPARERDQADIDRDVRLCFQDWLAQRQTEAQIERHWSLDKIPASLRRPATGRARF